MAQAVDHDPQTLHSQLGTAVECGMVLKRRRRGEGYMEWQHGAQPQPTENETVNYIPRAGSAIDKAIKALQAADGNILLEDQLVTQADLPFGDDPKSLLKFGVAEGFLQWERKAKGTLWGLGDRAPGEPPKALPPVQEIPVFVPAAVPPPASDPEVLVCKAEEAVAERPMPQVAAASSTTAA
jgi:hypothetical protein